LRESVTQGDVLAARMAAHRLKGSSSTLGGVHLAEVCVSLSAALRDNDLHVACTLLPEIEAAYLRLDAALNAYRVARLD